MITIKKSSTVALCPANPEKKKHVNPYEQGILKQRQLSIHYDKLYDKYQLEKIGKEKPRHQLHHLLFDAKDVQCQIKQTQIEQNIACQIFQRPSEPVEIVKIEEQKIKKKDKKSKSKSRQKSNEKLYANIEEIKKEFNTLSVKADPKQKQSERSRQKSSKKESRQKQFQKYFKMDDGQSISRIDVRDSYQYYEQTQTPEKASQNVSVNYEEDVEEESEEYYQSSRKMSSLVSQKLKTLSNKASRREMKQGQIELKNSKEIQNTTKEQEGPSKEKIKESSQREVNFQGSTFEAVINAYDFSKEKQYSTPAIQSPVSSDTVFYTCICDQSEMEVGPEEVEDTKVYTTTG